MAHRWGSWLVLLSLAACEPRGSAEPTKIGEADRGVTGASESMKRPAQDPLRHTWRTVDYPAIETPWGLDGKARPVLGFGEKDRGLRFDLSFSGPGNPDASLPVPRRGDVRVALHTPRGKVAPASADDEIRGWVGDQRGTGGSMIFVFPWQANDLLDAWIEVHLPAITYWLTVPYGFTRDPKEPLCPPAPGGRPAAPPIAAEPGRKVRVIPWDQVSYDLGWINEKWQLSLRHSNPFDAATVVTLYKDDNSRGLLSWSLESPKTTLRVEQHGGHAVEGIPMSVTREDDGFRRTDRFRLNRNPSAMDERSWGTLVVGVDGKELRVVMPSSLFKYTHGAPPQP